MNGYIALDGQVYTWDTEPVSPFTDDTDTKYPYRCTECQHRYEWSADDMSWQYEKPFLPCGHAWGMLEMVFEDESTEQRG